jgi:hypothetical protein
MSRPLNAARLASNQAENPSRNPLEILPGVSDVQEWCLCHLLLSDIIEMGRHCRLDVSGGCDTKTSVRVLSVDRYISKVDNNFSELPMVGESSPVHKVLLL